MRSFDDDTTWGGLRRDLRYTRATLRASKAHASELKEVQKLLDRWDALDGELTAAEDATVDANALVAWRDGALDRALGAFVRDLDHAVGGRRDDLRFTSFFSTAPNEVIRMALESEIERTAHFEDAAREVKLPKNAQDSLRAVEEARAEGKGALAEREAAAKAEATLSLRVRRLKDDANAVRRSVYNTLERHGLDRGLGHDYADLFFASAPKRAKKKAGKNSEGDAGGASDKGGATPR